VVHGTVEGSLVETGAEETDIPLAIEGQRAPVTAIFEPEDEPAPGDKIRLGIAPDRVHLFDLRTGDAIRA
jgi:hypothetical protein